MKMVRGLQLDERGLPTLEIEPPSATREGQPERDHMTRCDVTTEFENGIERDIVFRGMELTERIIFHPKWKVEFVRTRGIEMGTITNEIVEDETGALHLRFAFSLERADMTPGSPEEDEFAAGYAQGYLVSVQKTIDAIRELVRAGRLQTRQARVAPSTAGLH